MPPPPQARHIADPVRTLQEDDDDDVASAQQAVYRPDLSDLDQHLQGQTGKGKYISRWSVTEDDDLATMICVTEPVSPDHHTPGEVMSSIPLVTTRSRLIGLPVIKNCTLSLCSSNMCYTFAATDQSITLEEGIRHVSVPSLNSFSLTFGQNGQTEVKVDDENITYQSEPGSSEGQRDVVFMNETGTAQGWRSIHMRRFERKSDVISFMLDMLPPAERESFCSERDEMGWNILSWSCYKDDSETFSAVMNRLSSEQKLNLAASRTRDGRRWTLLHCAAAGKDSSTVVKVLLENFVEEATKWDLLTDRAGDEQTALHISVAQKNVKTVIVLLDEAHSKCGDLLHLKNGHGRTAKDFVTGSSLLGRLLQTATELNSARLNTLIERDEDQLVEFRLGNLCDASLETAINTKDARGMTAMHAVAKHNSTRTLAALMRLSSHEVSLHEAMVNSIFEHQLLHLAVEAKSCEVFDGFINFLTQDEMNEYVTKQTSGGNTVLHVAARSNSPDLLHQLLMKIKREDWTHSIQKVNDADETVLQIGDQHYSVRETLSVHQLFAERGARKFFEDRSDNLYNKEIPQDMVSSSYKRIENRSADELGYKRNVNYDAVKCLMFGDFSKANDLISSALKFDPQCIHALCNKAVYLLKSGATGDETVEDIAVKVLKQYSDNSGEPRLYAKVDYAYWLAEAVRTVQARDESCEIFEQCAMEASQCSDRQGVTAYCSYFHVKILVRMLQSRDSDFRDNFDTIVNKILRNFRTLAKVASQEYNSEILVWIAELQSNKIWRRVEQAMQSDELRDLIAECLRLLDCQDFHLETCIRRVMDCRGQYTYDRKLVMRIGKQCLQMAYQTDHMDGRVYWYNQALAFSEECINDSSDWYFMCYSTSSQALFNLWAIHFYQDNTKAVEDQFRARTGLLPQRDSDALRFVTEQYHKAGLLRGYQRNDYLLRAKQYLQEIVEKGDKGWKTHGIKYARIRHLLGDRNNEVEQTFRLALDACDKQRSYEYITALENIGRYYEIRRRFHDALNYYDDALKLYRAVGGPRRFIAHNGRQSIEQFNPKIFQRHYRH